jgi:hypothetical protein
MKKTNSHHKSKNDKHKKHDDIINDFENQKRKHLEKLGTKILVKQEKLDKLKEKHINTNFFKLF